MEVKSATSLRSTAHVDGGFVLATGAFLDDAKPQTLRALLEAGHAWSRE